MNKLKGDKFENHVLRIKQNAHPTSKDDKILNNWWRNQNKSYKTNEQIMKDPKIRKKFSQFKTKYAQYF